MKSNIHGKNNDDLFLLNIDVNSDNSAVDMMLMLVVSVVCIVYSELNDGHLFAIHMLYLKFSISINRLVRYPLRMNINKERKEKRRLPLYINKFIYVIRLSVFILIINIADDRRSVSEEKLITYAHR